MPLVKIEVSIPEVVKTVESFAANRKKAWEMIVTDVRKSVGDLVSQLVSAEMTVFLGTPDQSGNKRNGYTDRDYAIKGIGSVRIRVPIDRQRKFKSLVVPPHERMEPRLKEDIAVLHLAGLSTRILASMSNRILGIEISPKSVTNSLEVIREHAERWLTRPLTKQYWALYIDGTNFRIQRRGSTEKEPSLVVLGIDSSNRRSVLAVEPGTRDDVESWRSVFRELKLRGLDSSAIRVGIMDGLPGLEKLFREEFPNSVTARCWAHSMRNACAKAPARLRVGFKLLADRVMYADSEKAARQAFLDLQGEMGRDAERAVSCLAKDLDSLVTHYQFNRLLWRALKTTNPIERVNLEFKRRTKSMGTLGEHTLRSLVAFTCVRLEMGWQMRPVDMQSLQTFGMKREFVEETIETMGLLN